MQRLGVLVGLVLVVGLDAFLTSTPSASWVRPQSCQPVDHSRHGMRLYGKKKGASKEVAKMMRAKVCECLHLHVKHKA